MDFLLRNPTIADFAVGITLARSVVEAFPGCLVEKLGGEEHDLADPLERIPRPTAVSDLFLVHALSRAAAGRWMGSSTLSPLVGDG